MTDAPDTPDAADAPRRPDAPGDRPRRPRTTVTWALIIANVVVYGLQWLMLLGGLDPVALLGLAPYRLADAPWTFVTSGFAHSMSSLVHLPLNMYTLWVFGQMLEPELGRGRFLLVYLLSLLGGSAAVVLLSPLLSFTVGASGAIFGLFGAVLAYALWGGRRHRGNLRGILLLLVLNAVFGLLIPGISWQGHLGGLVTGAVVTGVLLAVGGGRRPRQS